MKNNFTFLFVFLTQLVISQIDEGKFIKGSVQSNKIPLEGINITNSSTKITVVSDQYGSFSILVKQGDILNFSAVNYEDLRKYINIQEFKTGAIAVDLTPKSIQLDEVVVNENSQINARNMGIIDRNLVMSTPAERRLKAAGDFKAKDLLMIFKSGALPFDPILNAINGTTKALKKELAIEKKVFAIAKLEGLFEHKYYIESLKIPEEYINGFQYYCVEDKDLVKSLNDKNKTMTMFLITNLASEYNKKRLGE